MINQVRHTLHWQGWHEAVVVTLLALLLPWWIFPDDPFLLEHLFFWPVLGPLLIALRYGFALGGISLLGLILGHLVLLKTGLVTLFHPYPYALLAAHALMVMLAGEFRDLWARKLIALQRQLAYTEQRLQSFQQSYHVQRLSHERMEQQMAGHALSLRESIQRIRGLICAGDSRSLESCADAILGLFVELAGVQSAAVYALDSASTVKPDALAAVGDVFTLQVADPMVAEAMTVREVIAVTPENVNRAPAYQAVIPVQDSSGRLHGVIVVKKMQFFALNEQTLVLMGVMAGHIGDILYHQITNPVLRVHEMPLFIQHTQRAQQDGVKFGLASQLLCLSAQNTPLNAPLLHQYLSTARRGLDIYLQQPNHAWWVLMPLTQEQDVEAFVQRLDRWLTERLGQGLAALGIEVTHHISLPADKERLAAVLSDTEPHP